MTTAESPLVSTGGLRGVDTFLGDDAPPIDRSNLPGRIVSSRVRLRQRFIDIWRSRELFLFLVRTQLKVKYKNSVLGLIWSMLNPALVLGVYYVVFQFFLKSGIHDFALYLFCGLLVWNFFSIALMGSSAAIVSAAGIVKKVSFPREILALSQVGTSVVFFFFQSLVLIAFLLGFHYAPDWRYLPLIGFAFVDLVLFTSAISVFVSAVNVYLRDVQHLIEVLLQAWFWGTPIVYSFAYPVWGLLHRHHLLWFYIIDPITPIILAFQRAIYGTRLPATALHPVIVSYSYHWYVGALGAVGLSSIVLGLGAMLVFGRIEGNFAEEL